MLAARLGRCAGVLLLLLAATAAVAGAPVDETEPATDLSAVPVHTDQEIRRFQTFAGPAPTPKLLNAWKNGFLRQRVNRAMAISAHGTFGYAFGWATEEGASNAALRNCRKFLFTEQFSDDCRLYAVNMRIVYPGLEFRIRPLDVHIGDFTFRNDYFFYGPRRAKGVIVWSHGYGGFFVASYKPAAWSLVTVLNLAGWDILRFDRQPDHDELWRSEARLARSVELLARVGYRRIVLAGQSRGALQSVRVLRREDVARVVAGVIAISPANNGYGNARTYLNAPDEWGRMVSAIRPGPLRFAAVFFDHDIYIPAAKAEADDARQTLTRAGIANMVVYETDPAITTTSDGKPTGHSGARSPLFTERYADCLATFIESGVAAGNCRH